MRICIKKSKPICRSKRILPWLFLLPSLAGTLLFVLVPFVDCLRLSLYDAMGKELVGGKNYVQVLQNEAFRQAAKNTVRFTAICIPLLLLSSFLTAVLVHSLGQAGEGMKTGFLAPMATPVASIVFLWQILFQDKGLINHILVELGQSPIRFLATDTAFWVLVGTYVWKNMGYDMVLWLAGLSGIPESLYEAARMDGAGSFACFRYITLPELSGVAYLVAVLSLVNSFKVFREAYLIAGSYPHESIYVLQHLFHNWFQSLDMQKLYPAAVMMAAAIAGILLVLRRAFRDAA